MQALGGFALGLHVEKTRQDRLLFKGRPIEPLLEANPYTSMEIPAREHSFRLFARMAGAGGDMGGGRCGALGVIGAGGGDVDGARLAEAVEERREIIDAPGDEMGHLSLTLELAVDAEKTSGNDSAAVMLVDLRPDDDIGHARLVFERQEDDARSGAGALAGDDQAGDTEHPSVRQG